MANLVPIDKVIETKLDITPPIKPESLSSDYQEVVVINGFGLIVQLSTVDRVDVPLIVKGLFRKGGQGWLGETCRGFDCWLDVAVEKPKLVLLF